MAQAGWRQAQRRLTHRSRTGRSKQGKSTSSTVTRPWPWAITPQPRDSPSTSAPLHRHHEGLPVAVDRADVQPVQADEKVTVVAVTPRRMTARANARRGLAHVEVLRMGCLVASNPGPAPLTHQRGEQGSPRLRLRRRDPTQVQRIAPLCDLLDQGFDVPTSRSLASLLHLLNSFDQP